MVVDIDELHRLLSHNYARIGCRMGDIDWMENHVLRYKLEYPSGEFDYVQCDVMAFFDKETDLALYLLRSTVNMGMLVQNVVDGRLDQFALDYSVYTQLQKPEGLH